MSRSRVDTGSLVMEVFKGGERAIPSWFRGDVLQEYMSDRDRGVALVDAAIDSELRGEGRPLRAIVALDSRGDKKNSASYLYAFRKLLTMSPKTASRRIRIGEAIAELVRGVGFDTSLLLDALDADKEAVAVSTENAVLISRSPYYQTLQQLATREAVQAFLWLHIMFPDNEAILAVDLLLVSNINAFLYIAQPDRYEELIMSAIEKRIPQALQDGEVRILYQIVNRFAEEDIREQALFTLDGALAKLGETPFYTVRSTKEIAWDKGVTDAYVALNHIYRWYTQRGTLSKEKALDLLDELLGANVGRGDFWRDVAMDSVVTRYEL